MENVYLLTVTNVTYRYEIRTVTYLCLRKEGMRKERYNYQVMQRKRRMRKYEYVMNSVRKEERNEIDMYET